MSGVPTPPGVDPSLNPKAAAKAAKAYAKATRPWFKKKRFWLLGVIALIVIIAVSSNSGSKGPTVVDSKGNPTTQSNGKAAVGSKENPAKIGTTLELAGTRYTVKSATTQKHIGDPSYGEDADGTFVIVVLTIENKKTETKTFSSSAAKFVAANGTSYDVSDKMFIDLKPDAFIFDDMQPNLPKTGSLVFDVPPSVLKGGLLKVSDLFGDGDAYIALNLK